MTESNNTIVSIGNWSLFGSWFCYPKNPNEEVQKEIFTRLRTTGIPPNLTDALIKDRIYGGFPCGDNPDRSHAYFAAGQYSYTSEANYPNDSRQDIWKELTKSNPDQPINTDDPFAYDFQK